jgi:hypothetical protein
MVRDALITIHGTMASTLVRLEFSGFLAVELQLLLAPVCQTTCSDLGYL